MEEAKERFTKGLMFVDEEDCNKALVEFKASYEIYPTAVVLYNIALCNDDLHKNAAALKYYSQYLDEAEEIPKDNETVIRERIGQLEKMVGTLSVSCNVEGASVLVDGKKIGEAPLEGDYVEIGDHELIVKKSGYKDYWADISVVSGKTNEVDVELELLKEVEGNEAIVETVTGKEDGKPGKKKTVPASAFWGVLGATLALGAGAVVVGGLNIDNRNKFLDTDYSDEDTWKDLKDRGETYNTVFLSLVGVAGAAAIATIVLGVFTDFKKGKKTCPGQLRADI
ncbi:MAG: PEGA domain-containing protein [Pseudomonadota bacterium]